MKINPFILTDAYKVSHPEQYPENTEYVYSNITPRSSRIKGVNKVVVFGLQYFMKEYLINQFNENFFNRNKAEVLKELELFFEDYFGSGAVSLDRYAALHDLGYLPLEIKALPEGTSCPVGVPFCTIINTEPEFYWVTNFIETLSQTVVWNSITAATIANRYRVLLDGWAEKTVGNNDYVDFQGHNFSMRGMSSVESGLTADAGHLLSFLGSDTLPGNLFVREYYNADPHKGLISCSVPATEHAVMCAGQKEDERETFRRLIQDTYPNGIVSIVSDTWDLWKVLREIAPSLREEIESRDGTVVFRPDSGDPVKIVCGYNFKKSNLNFSDIVYKADSQSWLMQNTNDEYEGWITNDGKYLTYSLEVLDENEYKGCVEILDEEFGSTINRKGYKELNPKVGLIYGDSITFERAQAICEQLAQKGYASSNVVFGIGSFTYQYNTRDTFSIACKATWVQVDGKEYNIFKDPITDDGTKKSACGLLKVERSQGSHGYSLVLKDQVSSEEEQSGELVTVFKNGKLIVDQNFEDIKKNVKNGRYLT